jgi:hypothetical protein
MQNPDLDDAYAYLMLTIASGTVRAATGMGFSAVAGDTAVLMADSADGPWLTLPARPVTGVTAVEMGGVPLAVGTWTLYGHRLYRPGGWGSYGGVYVANASTGWLSPSLVTVTYNHGYAVIPDDVKAATLAVAAELIANPQGLTAEDIDDYRWRRDATAGSSTPAVTALETVVRRYRPGARSVRLSR